ncbi:MAG: hypothetical protein RI958_492 [Actinomycetota bacterium]|jgi:hypothetical protein
MSRIRVGRAIAVLAVVLVASGSGAPARADRQGSAGDPSKATFEGSVVDLAVGWGQAAACAEVGVAVECYRTEAELLVAHPELVAGAVLSANREVVAASSCSSSLRLYRSSGYAGSALYLTTRSVVHNLSSFGFDNDTSSYRVGACSSAFYSGANLSGSQYPGSTGAYASASGMVGGWDNVVSSVIIF